MMEALRGRRQNRNEESDAKTADTRRNSGAAAGGSAASDANSPLPQTSSSHTPSFGGTSAFGLNPSSQQPRSTMPTPMSNPIADQMGRLQRNASSIGASQASPHADKSASEHRLTVGPGIKLKGEIANCESLVVEGHIEATANSQSVQIAECGSFTGEAEIGVADISGTFEGTLTITERLIIRSTGSVSGKIRYCGIEIESGGRLAGDIQVTEAPASKAEEPEATTEKTPEKKAESSPASQAASSNSSEQAAPAAKTASSGK
ncbi:MAG: polymer-forming cytoskeletal protein [Pseudomonadota bacterium]